MTGTARKYPLLAAVVVSILLQGGPAMGESISDSAAVEQALEQNPTLHAVVFDLRAAEEALRSAEAEYRPSMQVGIDGGHNETFGATNDGIAPNAEDNVGIDLSLTQPTKVGTEVSLEVGGSWRSSEVNRDPSTATGIDVGSAYGIDANIGVTQPLLRGAGRDVGEADIRSANLSKTAAEHARAQTASELVRDVLSAYWELWYAQKSVEVNRESSSLATQQLTDAETKVQALGTLARIDALRFATELASIEQTLARAEEDQRNRAIELGRLLGRAPGESETLISDNSLSTEEGMAERPLPSLDEIVESVNQSSSELRELATQLEAARSNVLVARDSTLPRLDLSARFGVGGLWNNETISTGELPNDRPAISGQLGLELELPIGNAQARADLGEARFEVEALEARLEAMKCQLESEAATSLDALRSARRQTELAARALEVSRELSRAEQESLRLGTSTALEVLVAQASLREAELELLRSLVDQRTAETSLRHLTGSLLQRFDTPTGTP